MNDSTTPHAYTYNHFDQLTQVTNADGNRTPGKTSTGIWAAVYDAENRPMSFTNAETNTVIECSYDYMGRRATKKVTVDGAVTLHHRYLYRGYLQIDSGAPLCAFTLSGQTLRVCPTGLTAVVRFACCDLTRSNHPALWLITWDPTQPIATRPLAIQKDGTWYTYGWDLTKNICEVYGINGYIRTNYTYTPYGAVTASGDVTQPIQWSSEFHDTELALVYYNYRHYNPTDGRWLGRDRIDILNEYIYVTNRPLWSIDILGERNTTNNRTDAMQLCHRIKENRLASIKKNKDYGKCDITITCKWTTNPPSFAVTKGQDITIYIPKCLRDGEIGLINTINHEILHAYDECKRGPILSCEELWYREIRGSYYGQCAQIKNESSRKNCAFKGAKKVLQV